MSKFERHIEFVDFIGNDGCTRSNLERIARGFFKDKIDAYLAAKIININKQPDSRDDFFTLTQVGIKLKNHEIKIEDVINQ